MNSPTVVRGSEGTSHRSAKLPTTDLPLQVQAGTLDCVNSGRSNRIDQPPSNAGHRSRRGRGDPSGEGGPELCPRLGVRQIRLRRAYNLRASIVTSGLRKDCVSEL